MYMCGRLRTRIVDASAWSGCSLIVHRFLIQMAILCALVSHNMYIISIINVVCLHVPGVDGVVVVLVLAVVVVLDLWAAVWRLLGKSAGLSVMVVMLVLWPHSLVHWLGVC